MSVWLAGALMVAAINPARRRAELADLAPVVAAGAGVMFAVLVVLGLVAEPLLDALDISAPNLRVGIGLLLAVRAGTDLLTRPAPPADGPRGQWAAVMPVFFPVLFRPEAALVAISVAVDGGVGGMALGSAVALLVLAGLAAVTPSAGVLRAVGAVTSGAAVVLAVDRIIDGVFAL